MTPSVKIYHNPECGTSRNTLALIQNAGIEPEVIEYLVTPPSRDELIQLISDAGLTVSKYYQRRSENDTSKDYYNIQKDIYQ